MQSMTTLVQQRMHMVERLLPALDWLAGHTESKLAGDPAHLVLGDRGEELAYFHLRKEGWIVTARKWRSAKQPGDLDIVAWDGDTLCFVEVKTRSSHHVASAESAVDSDKRRMVRRMARLYLQTLPEQPGSVRFDIVSVYLDEQKAPEVKRIPAAFAWSEPAYRWS